MDYLSKKFILFLSISFIFFTTLEIFTTYIYYNKAKESFLKNTTNNLINLEKQTSQYFISDTALSQFYAIDLLSNRLKKEHDLSSVYWNPIPCNQQKKSTIYKRGLVTLNKKHLIGNICYNLQFNKKVKNHIDEIYDFFFTAITMNIVLIIFIILLFKFIIINNFLNPIDKIINAVNSYKKDLKHPENDDYDSEVLRNLSNSIKKLINFTEQLKREKIIEETSKVLRIAKQVSHDIRSPLAVLNMLVTTELDSLDEDTRIIVRGQLGRIQDIANDLLIKNNPKYNDNKKNQDHNSQDLHRELLSSTIENIITEKRLYFRSKLNVSIEGDLYSKDNYGLFARINLIEFKRLLSNLVNNSVEAFDTNTGKVLIKLGTAIYNNKEMIEIKIEDNGKGIPPEILQTLGQEGVSYGKNISKESGHGLGLFHAKQAIESWGGQLLINSHIEVGTQISIFLKKETPPPWFLPTISIKHNMAILILDDDQGIHFTWNNRFKNFLHTENKISLFHFSTPQDFDHWMNTEKDNFESILCLSDYELIGIDETGLDILERHAIKNAVLVTSHYESKKIRERCAKLSIQLIPKMLAGFVPIHFKKKDLFDYIYIDDDPLMRKVWSQIVQKNGQSILTLSSTKNFQEYEDNISKETTQIFLDSELGENEIKGEVFAEKLYGLGYKNLFMASGHDKSHFSHLPWIKHVEKDYIKTVFTR